MRESTFGRIASPERHSLFIERVADANTLREAWYRVQRGGRTAGVDGMTVEGFRAHSERRLRELGEGLRSGAYRGSAVRRVNIPKPSGGWRALGIPTVIDRIAQSAAAMVIHDRIGPLYSDRSFAYRPFLGPRRAALFLKNVVSTAAWAVTADIETFFDNVEHRILGDQLRASGVDNAGIRLIVSWLLAPVHDKGYRYQPVKGLPQGSPIAPVLANLYLTGFDTTLEAEGFTHARYADDFVVLAADESQARRSLEYVRRYLAARLRLQIKPAKTQTIPTDEGFNFVGYRFTRTEWTLPPESIERFRDVCRGVFQECQTRAVPEAIKRHNDLARGWRHYYFGNSSEMDAQLTELDAWRSQECETYLRAGGIDAALAAAWFERVVEPPEQPAPPGAYAHGLEAAPDVSDAEPPGASDEWHEGSRTAAVERQGRAFSTASELRAAEIGRKQTPLLLADRWLRIPTFGAYVTKARNVLIVRRKKQVIFECPFDDVSCLTIEGAGVALSTSVLEECVARGIAVTLSRQSGKPIARLLSARPALDGSGIGRQIAARATRTGTRIVMSILESKLANQRALLRYHAKYRGREAGARLRLVTAAQAIKECALELRHFDGMPMWKARRGLFLVEAKAAAHYWSGFAALVPSRYGFSRRAHQNASDPVNKALNYGYGLLLGRVWIAVHRAGLEPAIGLLHTGRRKSAGLVFDLMEPFRQPVVDRLVLGLLGRGAHLRLKQDGHLTLRTRAALHRAFSHRLQSGASGSLVRQIQLGSTALRRALEGRAAYRAYRMTW